MICKIMIFCFFLENKSKKRIENAENCCVKKCWYGFGLLIPIMGFDEWFLFDSAVLLLLVHNFEIKIWFFTQFHFWILSILLKISRPN